MSVLPIRWKQGAVGILVLAGIYACVATGVGYDGDVGVVGVDYVGGYYEPGGYAYGGWGGGYRVGPPRGGDRGAAHLNSGHAGRGAPSIPTGSRGGGSRR
jgi:hypothetical protein